MLKIVKSRFQLIFIMMKMRFLNVSSIVILMCLFMIGCDKDEASNNSPSTPVLESPDNNTTIVGLAAEITWNTSTDIDGDAITYDIYLGTETDPITIVSENQSETSYTISDLTNMTTYFWKVVAIDGKGDSSTSEIHGFNTNAILGHWKSDTIVHPQYGVKFVQSHVFNDDGTGSLEQTGELSSSFSLTWSVDENLLYFDLIGTDFKDTVYHAFENSGNTMIFKESEVTPNVEATLHRVEE